MNAPNSPFETEIVPFGREAIARAAALIAGGLPVAIPTETVYGLAGDARSGEAVARIYAAKGRPSFNPLILHALDLEAAAKLAQFGSAALRLAERFWPGPLTLVLPALKGAPIAGLATAGLTTVAIRVPAARAMRALLEACGRPLAAPSANASGGLSPTRAGHVAASLAGRIPLIVDDGPCEHGLESTIVAVEPDRLRLLRPGPIAAGLLGSIAGLPVDTVENGAIEAPGQLASHYAPSKRLRLDATAALPGEWLIGFGPIGGDASLSPAGDPMEAAARLFELLHEADAGPAERIAVAPVPLDGLGMAINDRLRRAAADAQVRKANK